MPSYSKALRDPGNSEHEELTEWVGGNFSPEHFSVEETNLRLQRGRRAPAKSSPRVV